MWDGKTKNFLYGKIHIIISSNNVSVFHGDGLLNGRHVKVYFLFSLINIFGIYSVESPFPVAEQHLRKTPQLLTTFNIRIVLFVKAKTHLFIRGRVISYQNFNLSQCKAFLLLLHLAWPVVRRGPVALPFTLLPLFHCSPLSHGCLYFLQGEHKGTWGQWRRFWISF